MSDLFRDEELPADHPFSEQQEQARLILHALDHADLPVFAPGHEGDGAIGVTLYQLRQSAEELLQVAPDEPYSIPVLLMHRRIRRLALQIPAGSDPQALALGLEQIVFRPLHSDQHFKRSFERVASDWPEIRLLQNVPRNRWGALHHAANPNPGQIPMDEAITLCADLLRLRSKLRSRKESAESQVGRSLLRAHIEAIDRQLNHVRTMFARHARDNRQSDEPLMIDISAARLLSSRAVTAMIERYFARDKNDQRLVRAMYQTAAICRRALREVNHTRYFLPTLLPTFDRQEFESLFAPDVDAAEVRGAFMPDLNAVVISPNHAKLLSDPTTGDKLYPVHLHELAHASANNSEAAARDVLECQLAEGYAEIASERAVPMVEERLTRLHFTTTPEISAPTIGRVEYLPSTAYPKERAMMKEILDGMARAGREEEFLARINRAPSMVGLVNSMLSSKSGSEQLADTRQLLAKFMNGDERPLRDALTRIEARPSGPQHRQGRQTEPRIEGPGHRFDTTIR